ncbi:MAG: hypothetical protein IT430_09860 [Phycisphaerales bacterium]|nr:hypothetical protein [Phycisphaerales bacterium]
MTDLKLRIVASEGGSPPDAVVLSSADGTFGVRRQDTLAVIVADGTAMVQDAGDPTVWTYTVAGVVAGVVYEWVAEVQFPNSTHHFEGEVTAAAEADCAAMISIADADALLAVHVLSSELADWSGLSSADKGVLLCRAQQMIEAGRWDGVVYDDDQAYAFPRKDDDGDLIGDDNPADPDSPLAPLAVREALALLAFSFVNRADAWEQHESRLAGLASHSAGGISKAYTTPAGRSHAQQALQVIPAVWTRLARFWFRGGRIV